MKWKGKEDFEKIINDLNNKILDKNLSKIADPKINTIIVMFPYNQKGLFVPDNKDWLKIVQNMGSSTCLIVSPNSLVRAKPMVANDHLIITINEMILKYWEEIRDYIIANPNIKTIRVVTSDIDIERLKRDFNIVFSNFFRKFEVSYLTVMITPSFWKKVYQIREKLVLALPIWFYKLLSRSR